MIPIRLAAVLLALSLAVFGCETQDVRDDTNPDRKTDVVGDVRGPSDTVSAPSDDRATQLDDPLAAAVPFSGTKEQIRRVMARVPGAEQISVATSSADRLDWTGGRFGEEPVREWTFGFYNGRMVFGKLLFATAQVTDDLLGLYASRNGVAQTRYGNPVFDSESQVSRALMRFNDAEVAFIEEVGLSMVGRRFRIYTPTDSTADHLIVVSMIPEDSTLAEGVVEMTWYDRREAEAFTRATNGR